MLSFEKDLWREKWRGEHRINEGRFLSPTALRSNFPSSAFCTFRGLLRTEYRIIDVKEDGEERRSDGGDEQQWSC